MVVYVYNESTELFSSYYLKQSDNLGSTADTQNISICCSILGIAGKSGVRMTPEEISGKNVNTFSSYFSVVTGLHIDAISCKIILKSLTTF